MSCLPVGFTVPRCVLLVARVVIVNAMSPRSPCPPIKHLVQGCSSPVKTIPIYSAESCNRARARCYNNSGNASCHASCGKKLPGRTVAPANLVRVTIKMTGRYEGYGTMHLTIEPFGTTWPDSDGMGEYVLAESRSTGFALRFRGSSVAISPEQLDGQLLPL